MPRRAIIAAVVAALGLITPAAHADVRLAAGADCLTNPNCGPGLREVYGVNVAPVFVPLAVADAGISALDDGLADVAVAYSSNPEVSRPDILVLRDDRGLVGPDHVVPVVRTRTLRAYGRKGAREMRRRLNAASAVLSTLGLRSLNQSVLDGRLPEAVGAEFIDDNGLGLRGKRKHGPRFVIGFQSFSENEMLAHLYGEALRVAGFRVTVRSVHGFRPELVRAMRRGKIDMWPGYARSLLEYMSGHSGVDRRANIRGPLNRSLRRIGGRALQFAPGQDRNLFVMKADTARSLGVTTLSQVARLWPPAG
jgi:glycine betaine/choline ABC-type transport system substrate-binding protein